MKKLYYISIITLVLASCSSTINSDNVDPVIEDLILSNPNTVNYVEFPVESDVKFSAKFTDNELLGSYKFDIHFAGDGHRHTHVLPKKSISLSEWNFTRNGRLSGTEQTVTFSKLIDEEANAGPYHCVVYLTDEAGNSAEFTEKDFIVIRDDMPLYIITAPDFNNLVVKAGSSFLLEGIARAEKGLAKLAYIVRPVEDLGGDDILNFSELQDGSKEIAISTTISIPADTAPGMYILLLLASDKAGSVAQHIESFEVN
jgi:hypothetical protein